MVIQERHAHETPAHETPVHETPAYERDEQEPQRPSKRPHSAVDDSDPQSGSPASNNLVSSWLGSICPPAKRQRRNSEASMASGGDGGLGPPSPPSINTSDICDKHTQDHTAASRPATSRSASYRTTGGSSTRSLVDAEHYRLENLKMRNGIEMRVDREPLPPAIQALVEPLGLQQPPPTPTACDEKFVRAIRARNDCLAMSVKNSVRQRFDGSIFPRPEFGDPILRTDSLIMAEATLPTRFTSAALKKLSGRVRRLSRLSIPIPDILYGYSYEVFPREERSLLYHVLTDVNVVNENLNVLPFLIVEFRGDGESMWSCINECLGGSAACVNVGRRLNMKLVVNGQSPSFNSAVFSIAINHEIAHLYVTWRPSDPAAEYYMQRIGVYAVEDMHHYLILQRAVRKIIEWGIGPRLDHFRECLSLAGSENGKASDMSSAYVEEPKAQVEEPRAQVGGPKAQEFQAQEFQAQEFQAQEFQAQEFQAQLDELKTQMKELIKAQMEELKEVKAQTQVEEFVPSVVGSASQIKESVTHIVESVPQVEEYVSLL
ncbi:uncharacterized protein BBA_08605 [Beauveria bassiana ARSEF 2860]|uniref:DUF7924 domain-containing protein n=1 Tax=Beauveria bassiana (strain ARSEF 2860) TaxID=655819 RepID=J5JFZ7_BEAB2|nr:uncharacterized protein BBA_08605 [Beauveria bassiana ARSEF 2860]EJP62521.1 hypothetical protein BBA_08605 [Beauveria bassiana ARSEF 2860]